MARIRRSAYPYLSDEEFDTLAALDSPMKVQDFISAIPQNFERDGDSCMSVREVLRTNRAHCIEGALVASFAFLMHGRIPMLMDLEANDRDEDHVVALFTEGGYWGAISKGNHAYVRYRDPIYRSVRELAMSYFHEYYNPEGEKTLRGFTEPYTLARYAKADWITGRDAWRIAEDLCGVPHRPFLTKRQASSLRLVDPIQLTITKHREHRP